MKKLSWEIILAGLLFIVVAIFLLNKSSSKDEESTEFSTVQPVPPTPPSPPEPIHVIDIERLKELKALKGLKELEGLNDSGQVANLEKLKALAYLIPSEERDKFLTEIDGVLRDLTNDGIQIKFDSNDDIIIVKRDFEDIVEGSWTNTSPGIYTFQNEFDASEIDEVNIKLPVGSITIVGTSDDKSKFTIQASGQISSVEDLNSKIKTSSMFVNDQANFLISNQGDSEDRNIQLQATLYISNSIDISAELERGHIEVTNINGDQVYKTGGGHMKINKTQGDVVALSDGGNIIVNDAVGDITLRTLGGQLHIKQCIGDVSLDSKGGNVSIVDVSGEIISSTLGGNIFIALKDFNDDITAQNSAGNIKILLPKNIAADVELKGSSISEIEGFDFIGKKSNAHWEGTFNGGGNDIIAFTKYGTISIIGND